ncbi:MAG: sulfur transferase domain-containing protein [Acidobacteriota bacterium]
MLVRIFVALCLLVGLTTVPCGAEASPTDPAPPSAEAAAASDAPPAVLGLPNERNPLRGVVSGGQPTEAMLARAASLGFRTVINLRTPPEADRVPFDEPAAVEALGMTYIALPIAGADDLHLDSVNALTQLLDDPARHPILLHCGSGNRIGALLALKAYHLDGAAVDEAMAIGEAGGLTRLAPVVDALLTQAADAAETP